MSLFQDDEVMMLVGAYMQFLSFWNLWLLHNVDAQQIVWIILVGRQSCFMLSLVTGVGTSDTDTALDKIMTPKILLQKLLELL